MGNTATVDFVSRSTTLKSYILPITVANRRRSGYVTLESYILPITVANRRRNWYVELKGDIWNIDHTCSDF